MAGGVEFPELEWIVLVTPEDFGDTTPLPTQQATYTNEEAAVAVPAAPLPRSAGVSGTVADLPGIAAEMQVDFGWMLLYSSLHCISRFPFLFYQRVNTQTSTYQYHLHTRIRILERTKTLHRRWQHPITPLSSFVTQFVSLHCTF